MRTHVEPTGKTLGKFARNSSKPISDVEPWTSQNCPKYEPRILVYTVVTDICRKKGIRK